METQVFQRIPTRKRGRLEITGVLTPNQPLDTGDRRGLIPRFRACPGLGFGQRYPRESKGLSCGGRLNTEVFYGVFTAVDKRHKLLRPRKLWVWMP